MARNQIDWGPLARAAWQARENAHTFGNTRVGAAVMDISGKIFVGCNVEHRFRSHDIHAEVNAISTMVANGKTTLVAVLVAAERSCFTPCGACMDWIFQFGGADCFVAYQSQAGGQTTVFRASDLMPHYPQ